jgi:hypothetical protein
MQTGLFTKKAKRLATPSSDEGGALYVDESRVCHGGYS